MTFQVGDKVKWISSNVRKIGEVVAIVPVGGSPRSVGFPKAGGGGSERDHVTYIVRGRKRSYDNQPYGSTAVYWPVVSLLEPA